MKKLIFILLLCLTSSAFGQFMPQQKPMLGLQVNKGHQLGDFVACWLMNEGSGNKVFDLSANGNDGAFNAGTPVWTSGKYGSAIDFDGSSNILVANSPELELSNSITVIAVVKFDTLDGTDYRIIEKRDAGGQQFTCRVDNTDELNLAVQGDSGFTSTLNMSTGVWYSIAWVIDNNIASIYVDGVSYALNDNTLALTSNDADITIGSYYTGASFLDGQIDHIAIYNRALSASEIALLCREPFCMFAQDSVALMEAGIPAVAPGGQVIYINMGMIPLLLIPALILIKRKKCQVS